MQPSGERRIRTTAVWLIEDPGCWAIRGNMVEAERAGWWGRTMRLVSGQPRYVRLGCSGKARFYWSPLKIVSRAWGWFNLKISFWLCEGMKGEGKARRRNYCSFWWFRVLCHRLWLWWEKEMVSIGSMSPREETWMAVRVAEYTAQLWSGQRTSWGRAEMRDAKLKLTTS